MNKKYIVKSLTPWMVDELKAISDLTKFDLILLRSPEQFYSDSLDYIKENGSDILIKPYATGNIFLKIWIVVKFMFGNLKRFDVGYNAVLGLKSLFWFIRLDLSHFDKNSNIHAQFATQPAIIAYLIKLYFGREPKISFTFHAYDIYFDNKWFGKLVNESHVAFSISNFNIDYVKHKFNDSPKILLSRLGVFRSQINIDQKMKNDVFEIGLMSWFIEKKGIAYLLEAMKLFKSNQINNIQLKLAGDGPLKDSLTKFVEENELEDSVKFVGKIKGEEKEEFYNSLDAFVLPSVQLKNDQDGIPVVLMEAIAYGLPIISTDVSGIPEICVDNFNGKLISERNVDEIYDALLEFMENREQLLVFAQNSRKLSDSYDIEINSKRKLKQMKWL